MAEPWSSPTLGPHGAGPLDQLSPGPQEPFNLLQPRPFPIWIFGPMGPCAFWWFVVSKLLLGISWNV